ncbi:hypothetical protein OG371_45230 [Amycolatopsis sp. NBC_01480]
MKAVVWRGVADIRHEEVPDPPILEPGDAIGWIGWIVVLPGGSRGRWGPRRGRLALFAGTERPR